MADENEATASSNMPAKDVVYTSYVVPVTTGRHKITITMSKKEFYDGTNEEVAKRIIQYLPYALDIHKRNEGEIDHLYRYYKGEQAILNKTKIVRPEINHIVVENHAYEIVEFLKSYVFGNPITYAQKGEKGIETSNEKISALNQEMEYISKASDDKQIAEWQYICGTGYRFIDKGDDECPFSISVPDPRKTFVVYSNSIKEEVLFSGFISEQIDNDSLISEPANAFNQRRILTIYTDNFYMQIQGNYLGALDWEYVPIMQTISYGDQFSIDSIVYPLVPKGNRIIEYPLNNARLGRVELVETSLNAINQIKSNEVDDVDQFVQSLLVFINQEIDPEEYQKLIKLGAIEVNSNGTLPADVKLLSSHLSSKDTKTITDDLYNNVLSICGVPRLQDSPSGGDTGQARLIGEGWTMADERANQDELSFKKSERKALKLILDICDKAGNNEIKGLTPKDVEVKFTRNKQDNMLVKAQCLLNLKDAQVDPSVAFNTCGLFSDSNEVYLKSKGFYGDEFWKDKTERDTRANIDAPTDTTNLPKNSRVEVTEKTSNKQVITDASNEAE